MRALGAFVVLAVAVAASAAAQPNLSTQASFDPQLFHPAPGPDDFVTVEPATVLHHLQPGAGVYFNWARDPLTILTYSSRTMDPYGVTLHAQANVVGAEVWLGIGFWERFQIAASLPMTLFQNGDTFDGDYPPPDGVHLRPPVGFALGDPRIYLKVLLYGKAAGFQLALSHWLSIPVGNQDAFGGERHFSGFAGEPRVIAEWVGGRFSLALQVGFQWRAHTSYYYTVGAGQELTYAAAAGVDVANKRLRLMAELYGHYDFSSDADYTARAPLELDVAARVRVGIGFALTGGVGVGVLQGAGSPRPRVFLGVSFEKPVSDRDGDGIPDNLDKCPDVAEDRDGFQDQDGCPDPDNDGDGILDSADKCPNQPEDKDGFQDEDGCPDPDNDRDGIDDLHDACPNDAEDGKGERPHDGCPLDKTDSDGDGIVDPLDKCPKDPEDKDGFEDEDGCPDPDNDNDGIPDEFDECPNEPEDFDGVDDTDGCPDAGISGLRIKGGRVLTKKIIEFSDGGLTPDSFDALDQVALLLKARPKLFLRIESYWDDQAPDEGAARSRPHASGRWPCAATSSARA